MFKKYLGLYLICFNLLLTGCSVSSAESISGFQSLSHDAATCEDNTHNHDSTVNTIDLTKNNTVVVELYDGTKVKSSDLTLGTGYQFTNYDIVGGFTVSYQSGYDGRITDLHINDKSMTYGDVVDEYKSTFPPDYHVGSQEYIEMVGFSAISVTENTLSYETVDTFSRYDVYLEDAESFDIIYALSDIKVNGFVTTDFERMLDTLGRPRFANVNWDGSDNPSVSYYWDMGNDRYLTILSTGAIRFQTGEFLCNSKPMFEPFILDVKGD